MSKRFRVEPRDVSAKLAGRRLGLTEAQFDTFKAALFARGFPRPDVTTGLYDLKKIETWMDNRGPLDEPKPINASDVFDARMRDLRRRKRTRKQGIFPRR